ncbi:MAG: ATP-dependent DNA ligase [Candidatus Micrarchaeaceae archaeon]
MYFYQLAKGYEELEKVSSRLKMVDILAGLFKEMQAKEIKAAIYITQGVLLPPFEGVEFGVAEKIAEDALALATGIEKKEIEDLFKKYGDFGEVAEKCIENSKLKAIKTKEFTIDEIYTMLYNMALISGSGSKALKINKIASILVSLTPIEAKYIERYILGELRLGVGDATILEALALAFAGNREKKIVLENAYNLCNDLGYIGEELAENGLDKLRYFKVTPFKPIKPALAERLPTAEEIMEKMHGKCAVEQKYDGFRCQIHKQGNKIKIYSRNLEETTAMFPDIEKAAINEVKADAVIFEGEALAFNESTGEFRPFQETIQRKRKHQIAEKIEELPLHLFAFDIMYLDGKSYINEPYESRRKILESIIDGSAIIKPTKRIIATTPKELDAFFEESIENGLEGIVAKDLSASYTPGARKFSWIKMKRSYRGILSDSLDLVIVGYFRGKGSRTEFGFGGLLCAVYNKEKDMFETISKIGTGFTEHNMETFHNLLQKITTKTKPVRVDSIIMPDFWVEPKYVVTVKADEITKSPMHTCGRELDNNGVESGYALRFPRIIGNGFIREDKNPEDATTTKEIIEMYKQQKRVQAE